MSVELAAAQDALRLAEENIIQEQKDAEAKLALTNDQIGTLTTLSAVCAQLVPTQKNFSASEEKAAQEQKDLQAIIETASDRINILTGHGSRL